MAETARVQYVFMDVVGFTRNRSVEAQSDVVERLNSVVLTALETQNLPPDHTVLLPTGDGMAIALIDVPGVDVHLRLAIHILQLVAEHNGSGVDVARQFEVRVGINENIDNVLKDINGRRNVAGAGVSMAQRIMDKADGGQLLVGATVHDVLRQRERYMTSFRAFTARGKHGLTFSVYQFVSKDAPGLNVGVPSAFVVQKPLPTKFTKHEAYYVAHAFANREFLASRKADSTRNYAAAILLTFLADDSKNASETPDHEETTPHAWRAGIATFEEQYHHYNDLEFWVMAEFVRLLQEFRQTTLDEYLEGPSWDRSTWFVRNSAIDKLLAEWPAIASQFGITREKTG